MASSNEDYWNHSSSSKFNFDDEDLSVGQIDLVANDVFSTKREEIPVFSIDLLISKKCLDSLLLDADNQIIYSTPPVEDAVQKMIHGQRVVLELYKSYRDKLTLLDEALKTHNGDIILRVTDFLRRTLKFNIFCFVLQKRKQALVQYSNCLRVRGNIDELENLFMATGFTSNIRDLYFSNQREVSKQDMLIKLKYFISSHSQYLNHFNEAKILLENTKLLEWQIMRKENEESIIDQLKLVCEKQWEKNSNDDQIVEFKNLFKIDDVLYEWTIVDCLSRQGLWKKLISMFVKPNWLTKKNVLRTSVDSEKFVFGVSRHNPPKSVLEQLLLCLGDSDKALTLAEKFQCHKYIIEYYINQRDRLSLSNVLSKVEMKSEEYYLIKKAFESQDKKWKN